MSFSTLRNLLGWAVSSGMLLLACGGAPVAPTAEPAPIEGAQETPRGKTDSRVAGPTPGAPCSTPDCPGGASQCLCDDEGRVQWAIFDEDEDGSPDMSLSFSYDARGNRVSAERHDASGRVDERISYQYDAANNLLSREIDDKGSGPDGKVDRRCLFAQPCPPPHQGCQQECETP